MSVRSSLCFCLVGCVLMTWLTCHNVCAKPIRPDPNIAQGGCRALDDLLLQKSALKPNKKVLRDYALGIDAKDDKGPLGITLIPLLYPGDPAVRAKAIRLGYLVATDLSKNRQRGDQVLELSYSQPDKGKYRLHIGNLTTGKWISDKMVSQVVKRTEWFVKLNSSQQRDPQNGHSALYLPDGRQDVLAMVIKTKSERTWWGLFPSRYLMGGLFGASGGWCICCFLCGPQ